MPDTPHDIQFPLSGFDRSQQPDPSIKHPLRSLPGDFSGLHLLSLEYVGFKIIDPTVDIGFDIAAEYEEARRLHGGLE